MNEKVTKKIGEAHAFAQVLSTTFTNNESVMRELLGELADGVLATTTTQKNTLEEICTEAGTSDILLPKAEKTADKIGRMGEMYVGDDWDDVAEVLEWMSFFVGGAIIHWQLIASAAEALDHQELSTTANTGTKYYTELLEQLRQYAGKVGTERAQAA